MMMMMMMMMFEFDNPACFIGNKYFCSWFVFVFTSVRLTKQINETYTPVRLTEQIN